MAPGTFIFFCFVLQKSQELAFLPMIGLENAHEIK